MTPEQTKKALYAAGVMADAAIRLTGGEGINFPVAPCRVHELPERLSELRAAAEAYNALIVEASR